MKYRLTSTFGDLSAGTIVETLEEWSAGNPEEVAVTTVSPIARVAQELRWVENERVSVTVVKGTDYCYFDCPVELLQAVRPRSWSVPKLNSRARRRLKRMERKPEAFLVRH